MIPWYSKNFITCDMLRNDKSGWKKWLFSIHEESFRKSDDRLKVVKRRRNCLKIENHWFTRVCPLIFHVIDINSCPSYSYLNHLHTMFLSNISVLMFGKFTDILLLSRNMSVCFLLLLSLSLSNYDCLSVNFTEIVLQLPIIWLGKGDPLLFHKTFYFLNLIFYLF